MARPAKGVTPKPPSTAFDVVLDDRTTCTLESSPAPSRTVAVPPRAPSARVDATDDADDTVAAMLAALEQADEGDDEVEDGSATATAPTSAAAEAPAAPADERTPKRGWRQRFARPATAKTSIGDQTPVVYADPVMAGVTPTYTKLLVQSFVRRGLSGQWVTLEHATPYGELPPGRLRLLQLDVYEIKNGLELTSDGTKYIVPAGRFQHFIVRGPIERNGYCAHSKKLGQQVTFDPNAD